MKQQIQSYVDTLFANTQNKPCILEIKEELLANLNEKYDDLIVSGKDENEAYSIVISGIGDINSLLEDMGGKDEYKLLETENKKVARGLFTAMGVALYILSFVPVILLQNIDYSDAGAAIMFAIWAIATGIIVYGNIANKTKYIKKDSSFVEEYKEKVSSSGDRGKLMSALSSALWPLIVTIYLTISFLTEKWHITWIIFLLGLVAQQFIALIFASGKKRRGIIYGIFYSAATIVYFIVSLATNKWEWTWMIFLVCAAVTQIIRLIDLLLKSSNAGGEAK